MLVVVKTSEKYFTPENLVNYLGKKKAGAFQSDELNKKPTGRPSLFDDEIDSEGNVVAGLIQGKKIEGREAPGGKKLLPGPKKKTDATEVLNTMFNIVLPGREGKPKGVGRRKNVGQRLDKIAYGRGTKGGGTLVNKRRFIGGTTKRPRADDFLRQIEYRYNKKKRDKRIKSLMNHYIVSFPQEQIKADKLKKFIEDITPKNTNPFISYAHFDTDNIHIHIAELRIGKNLKIKDNKWEFNNAYKNLLVESLPVDKKGKKRIIEGVKIKKKILPQKNPNSFTR